MITPKPDCCETAPNSSPQKVLFKLLHAFLDAAVPSHVLPMLCNGRPALETFSSSCRMLDTLKHLKATVLYTRLSKRSRLLFEPSQISLQSSCTCFDMLQTPPACSSVPGCCADGPPSARGRQDPSQGLAAPGRLQRTTSSAAQQYDDRPAVARGAYGPDSEGPTENPPDAEASGMLLLLAIQAVYGHFRVRGSGVVRGVYGPDSNGPTEGPQHA